MLLAHAVLAEFHGDVRFDSTSLSNITDNDDGSESASAGRG
jgi:hypothetical protein